MFVKLAQAGSRIGIVFFANKGFELFKFHKYEDFTDLMHQININSNLFSQVVAEIP